MSLGDSVLLGRIQQGTGSPQLGLKLWRCWRKRRERGRERAGLRADLGRDPSEVSPWTLRP